LHLPCAVTNPAAAIGSWLAARWARLTLAARFAPMTARAGAAVLRVIVIERLWHVPVRVSPRIASLPGNR
jgi:hypothetical protein